MLPGVLLGLGRLRATAWLTCGLMWMTMEIGITHMALSVKVLTETLMDMTGKASLEVK